MTEFVYITDDTYSKKQVLRMEQLVLKVLNFDLAVCTQLCFVGQFSRAAASDDDARYLAQYLSELTLLDAETYLGYRHSQVAAACVALARHTLGIPAWPEAAVQMSGKDLVDRGYLVLYERAWQLSHLLPELHVDDFKDCLVQLHGTFTKAPELPQQAIREKYKQSK